MRISFMSALFLSLSLALASPAAALQAEAGVEGRQVVPEKVTFRSADGKTGVVGYLFKPEGAAGKVPAIVMLHGRSGAYSSLAKGTYDATTLSLRHKAWGQLWASKGYAALMVDDFGPLGFPKGFGRGTYKDRPAEVDEVVNRPLHAYGALRYLRSRPEIDGGRIGLMGWSNGGSTTLAAMADDKAGDMKVHGFKAAVSFYPGCGMKKRFEKNGYKPYAPVKVFMGTNDEEVSPKLCADLVKRSIGLGGTIDISMYEGAEHSFDTPTKARQKVEANVEAKADAEAKTIAFFAQQLGR
jgi:dienelactone hydrolase